MAVGLLFNAIEKAFVTQPSVPWAIHERVKLEMAEATVCRERRRDPVASQQQTHDAKFRGRYQDYWPTVELAKCMADLWGVQRLWHKWLTRRMRGKTWSLKC